MTENSTEQFEGEALLCKRFVRELQRTKPEDIGAVKYKTDFGDMWVIPNRMLCEGQIGALKALK